MSHLFDLPLEILVDITQFLSTKDILNLSLCSKYLRDILYAIKINDKVEFDKISGLNYFDSFTNVVYRKSGNVFSKSLYVLNWMCKENLPSKLPDSLKSLHLGCYYNQPLLQLPDSLKNLHLGHYYNHLLPQLPDPLKSLHLSSYYNQTLPQFPDSLKSLHLSHYYNQTLPQLPDSLKSLHLGYDYNKPLPQLPNSLRLLKIYRGFLLPTLSSNITIEFFG